MKSEDDTLSLTGRKFYKKYSDSKYISKFISKQALVQSEAYQDLAGVLQEQVSDFWDITNSLTVSGL
jgi:hypothetical protein